MNGQNRKTGRGGDRRGRELARRIIRALGCEPLGANSNAFRMGGNLAVLKTASRASHFVVTAKMLSQLAWVVCAVEIKRNEGECVVDLYKLTADEFRRLSTPSKSKSHASRGAWSVPKSAIVDDFRPCRRGLRFPLPEDPDI